MSTRENGFIKHDTDKLDYTLVDPCVMAAIAHVSAHGAKKYGRENWKLAFEAEDGVATYHKALLRHLVAYQSGEAVDAESGCPHLYHAAWNIMAMIYGTYVHGGGR